MNTDYYMIDVKGVREKKDKILSIINMRGPSLPIQIARAIDTQGLFASAFLAELCTEKKLKMSNMKIGSSPLYYLEGQENLLENFIEHLNSREKEAFSLLKKEKILDDSKLEPVVRVALRAIKDFAVPVRVRVDGDVKTFWKHFSLPENDVKKIIRDKLITKKPEEKEKPEIKKISEEIKEKQVILKAEKEIKRAQKKIKEYEFCKSIRDYIAGKNIEITEIILERKRELIAKIRIDIALGKQDFLLVAKDKKNINDNDLTLALQKAQSEKMPAYFISVGKLNKKAEEYLSEWKNLVKYDSAKL